MTLLTIIQILYRICHSPGLSCTGKQSFAYEGRSSSHHYTLKSGIRSPRWHLHDITADVQDAIVIWKWKCGYNRYCSFSKSQNIRILVGLRNFQHVLYLLSKTHYIFTCHASWSSLFNNEIFLFGITRWQYTNMSRMSITVREVKIWYF